MPIYIGHKGFIIVLDFTTEKKNKLSLIVDKLTNSITTFKGSKYIYITNSITTFKGSKYI